MVDDFIARKQGKTPVKYELPELEQVLSDTYGVIAYQEQVMRISNVVAGFTLGEADLLRKAMGKKKADVMAAMRAKFVEGATRNGHAEKKATHIFDLMEHFAGYGFNKSHSTAYAYLAYQTAYLKANYPWHFAAALLTIEAQNTDKLALYLGECRDRGIPVLPPSVNESELRFTVEPGKGVRFGLTAIKNVGEGAIESLLAVRKKQGRLTSLHALCEDLDLRLANKRVFESLVKAGAFDGFAAGRSRAGRSAVAPRSGRACSPPSTRRASTARAPSAIATKDRPNSSARSAARTMARPAGETLSAAAGSDAVDAKPSSSVSRRRRSVCTGADIPVDRYASDLAAFGARSTTELADAPVSGSRGDAWGPGGPKPIEPDTSIGGIIAACRQLKTRKGDRMAVFTLEDAGGGVEVIVFPGGLSARGEPDRAGHAGPGSRQARTRR